MGKVKVRKKFKNQPTEIQSVFLDTLPEKAAVFKGTEIVIHVFLQRDLLYLIFTRLFVSFGAFSSCLMSYHTLLGNLTPDLIREFLTLAGWLLALLFGKKITKT